MNGVNLYGVHLELTTDCNLRCTYCAVSQPGYPVTTMAADRLGDLVEQLKSNGVRHVQINGHGESTLLPYWKDVAGNLAVNDFELSIITNMARELTEEEVDVFSKFAFIETSIDSSDRAINRDVRRKVDVRTQYSNLLRIRGRAIETGRTPPKFGFSIVVYDRNVSGLSKLVAVGLALGIEHFRFCSLYKHPDIDGVDPVMPITSLRGDALRVAASEIRATLAFLDEKKAPYLFMEGLLDVLEHVSADGEILVKDDEEIGTTQRVYVAPKTGETRDCLDPWAFSQIRGDWSVALCCWSGSIGNLSEGKTLREIVSSPEAEEIRKGLLTGKLPLACKTCIDRPTTTIENLEKRVQMHMMHEGRYQKIAIHGRINEIAP